MKCKCKYGQENHMTTSWKKENWNGHCCVQYRGPDGFIKECPCLGFEGVK